MNDDSKFIELDAKVRRKEASDEEKEIYMGMLLARNSITNQQYKDYCEGKRRQEILKIGLIAAGGNLLTLLIKDIVGDD